MRTLRTLRGARLILPVLAVLAATAGCTSAPESGDPGLTGASEAPADPLLEAAATGPSWESTSPEFCAGVAALTAAGSLTPDQIIERYRALLSTAPAEIAPEIEALIEFLTTGESPQFAEPAPVPDPPPATASSEDPLEDPTARWWDEVLYGTADAEQLAVTMAEFLEFRCRGTAVNPLPAPSGLENQPTD